MLLIDDLVTAPGHFIFWIFKQVHEAAREELAGEAERITASLSELHLMLGQGRISEEEFDAEENRLLDRLDQIEGTGPQDDESDDAAAQQDIAGQAMQKDIGVQAARHDTGNRARRRNVRNRAIGGRPQPPLSGPSHGRPSTAPR
jgi:Gas vesicle protein G